MIDSVIDEISIDTMIERLAPRERDVCKYYFIEQLPAEICAHKMKCGRQNIYETAARIKVKLSELGYGDIGHIASGRRTLIRNLTYLYMITQYPRRVTLDELMEAWPTHPVLSDYWPLYPSSMQSIVNSLSLELYEAQKTTKTDK